MIIEFEGWGRNHGTKVIHRGVLKNEYVTKKPFPMKKGEIKIEPLDPDGPTGEGVRVHFSSEIRMNGEYLGTMKLSTREVIRLLKASIGNKSAKELIEELAKA